MHNVTDDYLKQAISRKLEQLRHKSQKTLEAAASYLDMDYAQYYRMIKGRNLPHLTTLLKLSNAYGVGLAWWFNDLPSLSVKEKKDIHKNIQEMELLERFRKLKTRAKGLVLKIMEDIEAVSLA
ncbi:helix-turn-helix XRE-family transcriptional regulators [Candidatus Termititenax persephonae]|uniref:Helix-turn-helix XRE-family transcriptional regulators n=1 Tax=Candidatus Termititenax persephonae TaxID=2218525 RepID=A0A388TGG1_9BACT|nr:helix-turn-helix XRE-family transcriptional regulators [Candidatus Termititenax persephonae]